MMTSVPTNKFRALSLSNSSYFDAYQTAKQNQV